MLLQYASLPESAVKDATGMAALAKAYVALEDYQRGKRAMTDAVERLAQETQNTGLLPIAQIAAEHADENRWPEALRAMDQVVSGAKDQKVLPADFLIAYNGWRDGVVE